MALSTTQRFLVEANHAADAEGYFAFQAVGAALGYSAMQSDAAMRSLGERKMLVGLDHGQGRLLTAGREFAGRLETKISSTAGRAN